MRSWRRESALAQSHDGAGSEAWVLRDEDVIVERFPVSARYGKPLDILRLRGEGTVELREYARQFEQIVQRLYGGHELDTLSGCPCCEQSTQSAATVITVYGVAYLRCGACGHVFVGAQPTPKALASAFEEEGDLSTFYVDPATLDVRMKEIIQPKLDWVLDVYRREHGRAPRSLVDIGAGAGHFVAGCRRNGLRAEGYEISKSSVRFAKEVFSLDLIHGDYLAQERGDEFDVVTMWGLLEYAPDPGKFIAAARRQMSAYGGMLILEVPRADSLSLAVQQQFADSVWRHAMPDSHMNLFSDASLATVLYDNGFRPVAAWYFGMDVYELLMQIGLRLESEEFLRRFAALVPALQSQLDASRFSDDIVVAALPI